MGASGAEAGDGERSPATADLALVADVLARQPDALDQFIERMHCVPRFVKCLAARRRQSLAPEILDDIVQDVLAVVWRRLADYRGDAALETWVFRICDFQMRNALRRVGSGSRTGVSLDDVAELAAPAPEFDADSERLQQGIDALPPGEAQVIRKKHYQGLTFLEIAAQLLLSPNTVKSRYYRGLDSLRRFYRSREEDGE